MSLTEAVATELADRFPPGTPLRIGSRKSPMAMYQAEHVATLLRARVPAIPVEVVGMETSADLWHGNLAELGGKGLFTKEIDRALVAGRVDLAVHCMKDVPGDVPLPPGTAFGAHLSREDVRDVVVLPAGSPLRGLADLAAGARVGTSSVRRRAQLGLYRPDLRPERIRGNVNSRLARLDAGEYDALLLAGAGLRRIGLADRITEVLPIHAHDAETVSMMPAIGAGVISVQVRSADVAVLRLVDELNDPTTADLVLAERTALHMLQGHCNSPIAGHAFRTPDGQLCMVGMVFDADGTRWVRAQLWGEADDPAALGAAVAADLLRQGARKLITATRL